MLTAHRELGPTPGTYGKRWQILDEVNGELVVVAVVNTKREAAAVVKRQALGSGFAPAADT